MCTFPCALIKCRLQLALFCMQCFEVFVTNPYADRIVKSRLYIDGVGVSSKSIKEKQWGTHKGVRVDDKNTRRLKFCALQLTGRFRGWFLKYL